MLCRRARPGRRSTAFIWRKSRRCWNELAVFRSCPRKRASRAAGSDSCICSPGSPLSTRAFTPVFDGLWGRADGTSAVPLIESKIDLHGEAFGRNRQHMLSLIARLRALEARAAEKSAGARPLFDRRGQWLPRERVARLIDIGAPWLELCSIAGYGLDTDDLDRSVPGGGMIAGIGYVSGVRCMVVASDSGIDAGAIQHMGREKLLRAQELALTNKLPFVHLVESAGANLLRYRVEGFIHGGAIFHNLAKLSAAGIPVITVVHGSSTAGGAHKAGLSGFLIMRRGPAEAVLSRPPPLKAATRGTVSRA